MGWQADHRRYHHAPQSRRRLPMFKSTIDFATRHPKRVIALWAVVAFALASLSGLFGYKPVTDDTAQFLPKGSESSQATKYAQSAFGQQKGAQTVTVLVKRADVKTLTAADRAEVQALATAMPRTEFDADRPAVKGLPGDLEQRAGHILAVRAGPLATGGRFQLVGLAWKASVTDPVAQEYFRQVRDRVADQARHHDLKVGFTGGVATLTDSLK